VISLSRQQKQYIGLQFIIDLTTPKSAYGKERLRDVQPYTPEQQDELQRQLDNIERTLLHRPRLESEYRSLEQVFAKIKDIRKSILKCRSGILGEIDLFEIKCYLLQLTEITPLFECINDHSGYEGIAFKDTAQALQLLDPEQNRVATFHISNRYSAKLTRIRKEKQELEEQMRRYPFRDVPAALLGQRQSLAEEEEKEEQNVRSELTRKLEPFVLPLLANADTIAELDLVIQKAAVALKYNAAKPLLGGETVSFVDMLNPQIAALLHEQGKEFTAITIELCKGATVITGANMGGKSVALSTAALNIVLIHYGFYPFAARAVSPLFDSLHIISGNLESREHGLSSFGGEVISFNKIAADIDKGFACVLIDEFAHGTNPEEGAAIAQGVTEFLNESDAISLLTTHYDKVAEHANAHYQIAGLKQLDLEELKKETDSLENTDKVRRITGYMNYNLVLADNKQKPPHEALNVCYLLGMPDEIITKIVNNYKPPPEL
jgi:dsDNA-specific endonuclease/ATPase MutS2